MTKQHCVICDSENVELMTNQTKLIKLKVQNGHKEFELNGLSFFKCLNCGEGFYNPEQFELHFEKLNECLDQERRKKGLLTGREIKAIRKKLNLTQAGLEEELDLPKNTIVRWETNKVDQSKMADIVLRVLDKHGLNIFKDLKTNTEPKAS